MDLGGVIKSLFKLAESWLVFTRLDTHKTR